MNDHERALIARYHAMVDEPSAAERADIQDLLRRFVWAGCPLATRKSCWAALVEPGYEGFRIVARSLPDFPIDRARDSKLKLLSRRSPKDVQMKSRVQIVGIIGSLRCRSRSRRAVAVLR